MIPRDQRKSLLNEYTDLVKENTLHFDRMQAKLLSELEVFAIELEEKSS